MRRNAPRSLRAATSWIATLFFLSASLGAEEPTISLLGSAQIVHYADKEYSGTPQTWHVVQGPDDFIYLLDSYSLHRFDGVRWEFVVGVTSGRDILFDPSGRLLVRTNEDLGFVDFSSEETRFVSLLKPIADEHRDSERTQSLQTTTDGILFSTTRHVYFQRTGEEPEALLHSPDLKLRRAFARRGRIYVDTVDGLYALRNGALTPIAGAETLRGAVVESLIDRTSISADSKTEALVFTAQGGLFLLRENEDGETLSVLDAEANEFLRENRVGSAVRTSRGVLVGTIYGGAAILNERGQILERFDERRHRSMNNTVYRVSEDSRGNFWFATDFGVVRVPRSPVRHMIEPEDVEGSLHRSYRHNGHLYVATRIGLYRSQKPLSPKFDPLLQRVEGISSGTWFLKSADEETLLAATYDGVFTLRGDEVEKICSSVTVDFFSSDVFPNHFFAGTSAGLKMIGRRGDRWECVRTIQDVEGYVYEIAEGPEAEIIVRTSENTLHILLFSEDLDADPEIIDHRLPPGAEFFRFDEEIYLSVVDQGIFRYLGLDVARSEYPFASDDDFLKRHALEGGDDLPHLVDYEPETGRMWLESVGLLEFAERRPDGTFHRRRAASDQITFWCDIYKDPEYDLYWLTNSSGAMLFDPNLQRVGTPPATRLRRASALRSHEDLSSEDGIVALPFHENSVRFEVAAPVFDQLGSSLFQYRLDGFEDEWSEWTEETKKEYTNLREGDYRFRIRSKDLWNETAAEASIQWNVLPPIYRTLWAYALYILTLFGVVALAVRLHRRKLDRERAINRRLREVDRLKDEFLAKTSHELRTPLYGITGLAESMLTQGSVTDDVKTNLSLIVSSGRRLGHLVGDILDFSKLRHQSLILHRGAVELHAAVDVVFTLCAPLLGEKDLRFENAVPSDLPTAYADENRLQQILYNLVGNAIKFTESGVVLATARETSDGFLEIEIRDTGIGVAADQQTKIFGAFEQADASIEREYGGAGLGLAVTRRLVELHEGTIRVESNLGEGASFFFTLPPADETRPPNYARTEEDVLSRASAASDPSPESVLAAANPAAQRLDEEEIDFEEALALETGERIRILAVDDEPINRQVLRNFLPPQYFDLVTSESGEQALQRIREQSFDIVLLDVMMPKVSGFEVCRELRETHPLESLPILFLTAKDRAEDVETGLSLGANDYLPKPIARGELLARLRPHLELLRTHRNLEDLVEEKVAHIKVLEGILPICLSCKKIRDEDDGWSQMETYIARHSEAEFSHGICPDCMASYQSGKT